MNSIYRFSYLNTYAIISAKIHILFRNVTFTKYEPSVQQRALQLQNKDNEKYGLLCFMQI